jgi:predicted tellurium resistance membrane protein TerC
MLIFGLTLSMALMGLAASFIASLLQRRRWIAYVGLAVILYVACEMNYRGALEMWPMLALPPHINNIPSNARATIALTHVFRYGQRRMPNHRLDHHLRQGI